MTRKPKNASPKYKGILKEPIDRDYYFRDLTLLEREIVGEDGLKNEFVKLSLRKLDALYEHYGVGRGQPGAADELILELAKAHVPGFKIKSLKDKRLKWDTDRLMQLHATFLRLRPRFDSDDAVFAHIANNPAYQKLTGGVKKATIKERFVRRASKVKYNPYLQMMRTLEQRGAPRRIIDDFWRMYREKMAHVPGEAPELK
ncbi:MAG TPA: hypothetical protein VIL84_14455 [Devosiaceae bacterium]